MARNKFTLVGFQDEKRFVSSLAKRLGARPLFASEFTYAAGERALVGPKNPGRHVVVAANIGEEPEALFRALLLAEALRSSGARRVILVAPWIAYGRQDRPTKAGESPAGIIVARLLARAFDRIVTLDAHSERFRRAFSSKLVNVLPPVDLIASKYDAVAAPDRGAHNRARRFAKAMRMPLVQLVKARRGKTVSVRIEGMPKLASARILLIDDMADSGSTLFEAAKALKARGAKQVDAFVTHAIDLAALKRKSRGRLGAVHAAFDHASNTYLITILSLLASTLTSSPSFTLPSTMRRASSSRTKS